MKHKIWMLDIAREQSPTLDHLYQFASLALESGYTGLGLYLEHRFAYPSTPWAHGTGCVTPEMVRSLQSEYPSLQIIPFINLLGHFEGFLYTEEGKVHRAELFNGLQACASKPEFVALANQILDDTMEIFTSEIIHIGGDETAQLDANPLDKARLEGYEGDGKAKIYGEHFGPLAHRVVQAGRVPGVWGDIFLDHPEALKHMPPETLLFDWQYFNGLSETSPRLMETGLKVVGSPTFHVYNAPWMHLEASDRNVREVSRDAQSLGLEGVCLTTWEFGCFGAVDTILPAVRAASAIMDDPENAPALADAYEGDWADLMGRQLEQLGSPFGYSQTRCSLKARLLLYRNPFLAWMHHGEELSGELGDKALQICERALYATDDEGEKGVTLFVRGAIEFIRISEKARLQYAEGRPEQAIATLAPTRYLFETLETVAKRSLERIGGSRADIERCRAAREHVELVIKRLRDCGDRQLGYLPAWEVLTNPRFMPHDQGCWWLINKWANQ